MAQDRLPPGTVHALPSDVQSALRSDPTTLGVWRDITPLARNEWICWVESAKRDDTRKRRIGQIPDRMAKGQRRPCCWPGCDHRAKNGM